MVLIKDNYHGRDLPRQSWQLPKNDALAAKTSGPSLKSDVVATNAQTNLLKDQPICVKKTKISCLGAIYTFYM